MCLLLFFFFLLHDPICANRITNDRPRAQADGPVVVAHVVRALRTVHAQIGKAKSGEGGEKGGGLSFMHGTRWTTRGDGAAGVPLSTGPMRRMDQGVSG